MQCDKRIFKLDLRLKFNCSSITKIVKMELLWYGTTSYVACLSVCHSRFFLLVLNCMFAKLWHLRWYSFVIAHFRTGMFMLGEM